MVKEKQTKGNDKIHVLHLSKAASYEDLDSKSANNDTLVMGFFDNLEEIFQYNGKGGDSVDHLSAFGIHTSSKIAHQGLTAKQLFTLIEMENPLKCHFDISQGNEAIYASPNYGKGIIPDWDNPAKDEAGLITEPIYPAFIGIISVSLNYFDAINIETIRKDLEDFIRMARTNAEIPFSAGEISRYADVRFFRCINCSDLCITVSTIRLMDILLISKAIQICAGQKSRAQFSPAWSFVTVPTKAFVPPEDVELLRKAAEKERRIIGYDQYISKVVNMNSYRENPNQNIEKNETHTDREAITVDFRISFKDFSSEEKFLSCLDDAKNFEKTIFNRSVDNIYRVAGVLGNGTYSVHLPFHEYLELFRFKYTHKSSVFTDPKEFKSKQTWLAYLIEAVIGKKLQEDKSDNHENSGESQNKKVEISYQRVRFCYPKHIFRDSSNSPTLFKKACDKYQMSVLDAGMNQDAGRYPEKVKDNIEKLIHEMLQKLSIYRNKIISNEYRFREAIYLAKDLSYTYADMFARNNIHTTIFTTQLLALLRNTENSCEMLEHTQEEEKARHILEAVTENLRFACLALSKYNHEVVTNSGNNFNVQNYEIQSKVNIEKYVVAYSAFLQEICDDYRKEFPGDEELPAEKLYPFVYLDIEQKKIHMYTLFRENRYRGALGNSPLMLAVAIPNYRRFANIYRMLPQLIHEISHRFIYVTDYTVENKFLLRKGAEYLSEQISEQFCVPAINEPELKRIRADVQKQFASVLYKHIEARVSKKLLKQTSKIMMRDAILHPYVDYYCSEGTGDINAITQTYPGKYDQKFDWKEMKEALKDLLKPLMADPLQPECCLDPMETPYLLCTEFRNMLHAAEKNNLDGAEAAVKKLAQIFGNYTKQNYLLEDANLNEEQILEEYESARKTVEEGIRIVYTLNAEYEKVCNKITIDHQVFSNMLAVIMEGGLNHLDDICPLIWETAEKELDDMSEIEFDNLSEEDAEELLQDTIYSHVIDFYMAEETSQMGKALAKLKLRLGADSGFTEEFNRLEQQHKSYCDLIKMIQSVSVIQITQVCPEHERLGYALKKSIRALLKRYADNWKQLSQIEWDFLNRFSDIHWTSDRIDLILRGIGQRNMVEEWFAYTTVHREVCADLGMCAAFGFDAFGYLVYMSNLFIEHMDGEDLTLESMENKPEVTYDFRTARYMEVVKTLSADVSPCLVKKTNSMLHTLCENVIIHLLPALKKLQGESKQQLFDSGILTRISNTCQENLKDGVSLASIMQNASKLEILLNRLGCDMRAFLGENPSCENAENVRQRINVLSDYLRYTRVIGQIGFFLKKSGFFLEHSIPEAEDFYIDLYQKKIRKAEWTQSITNEKEKEKGSFGWLSHKIGVYYNTWYSQLKNGYDFSEQIEFILHYYEKAHRRYKPMREFLKTQEENMGDHMKTKESLSEFAEQCMKCFFTDLVEKNVNETKEAAAGSCVCSETTL